MLASKPTSTEWKRGNCVTCGRTNRAGQASVEPMRSQHGEIIHPAGSHHCHVCWEEYGLIAVTMIDYMQQDSERLEKESVELRRKSRQLDSEIENSLASWSKKGGA